MVILALLFTVAILTVGYLAFGIGLRLFFIRFFGSYILWLLGPNTASYASIQVIFSVVFVLFLMHRVKERFFSFFRALANITNVPIPEILSWRVVLLAVTSVGEWWEIPYLMRRNYEFGNYLAWTFFAAIGITEMAHFIFPFFVDRPYSYFPGMASVFLLAPVAWYGMWRLSRKTPTVA